MSAHSIKLVQDSWQRCEPLSVQIGTLFYQKLFVAAPSVKQLFHDDAQAQGSKLMGSLAAVIPQLNDLGAVKKVLAELGARHVGYGAQEAHYPVVGQCLLDAIGDTLKEDFTQEDREAWTEIYGVIVQIMVEAMKDVNSASSDE